jgi:transcription elongation factor Elf1
MLWIDIKYVNLLSYRLRNFKRLSQYSYQFSCPLCGDSATNKRKSRGYIYRKSEKLNYYCHNCSASMSVGRFIKTIDPNLYDEMVFEQYKPKQDNADVIDLAKFRTEMPVFKKSDTPFAGLKKISDLSPTHFAREYVEDRLIPEHHYDDLYFTPKFFSWASDVLPGKYKIPPVDEPRLIFPFRNRNGILTGFQGRKLIDSTGAKYIFLMLTDEEPMIFGLNNISLKTPIYVFEGPIDSLFIPNSIACGGGDISADLQRLQIDARHFVVCYDNEPRSKFTVKKMESAVLRGFSVCVFSDTVEKDVNEMVKKNINRGLSNACFTVWTNIKHNTYDGIAASMAISTWKRTK